MRLHLPALLIAAAVLSAQAPPKEQPGPLGNGAFLLPTAWTIQPAGKQVPLGAMPLSTALTPDGRYLIVLNSGGKQPSLTLLDAASATAVSTVNLPDAGLGLAIASRGDLVYVSGGPSAAVYEFTLANGRLEPARTFPVVSATRSELDFVGDVALSADGRLLYVAELYKDSVAVINPQSGVILRRIKTGRRPYRVLVHPDGKSFFTTHWSDGTLGHYDAADGNQLNLVRIGPHATDMVWRAGGPADPVPGEPTWIARLFVTAANTNNIYTVAVTSGNDLRLIESINIATSPYQPLGMTPSALGLSADSKRLYVACSDANVVAALDVSLDRGVVDGYIPTGAYPTAVRSLPSGAVVAINGKGDGSGPNGSASFIDPKDLKTLTAIAVANSAHRDAELPSLPKIDHIVYIVRDPNSPSGPNAAKLAKEFVHFDNFWPIGEGAENQFWATAAIAPDYVQKMRGRLIDVNLQQPDAAPPTGYLWSNAASAGLPVRNFGFFVSNKADATPGGEQVTVRDPVLARITNRNYRGADPAYSDADRAKAFLAEFAEYEKANQMPRLVVLYLPGTGPESDAALGSIAAAISKSRFWATSLIAVQGGKAPALLVSPYIRRGSSEGLMHNTVSLLRTVELLLGLRPMTTYDAAARPIIAAFQEQPDPTPAFAAEPAAGK